MSLKRNLIFVKIFLIILLLSACNKPASPTITQTPGDIAGIPTLTIAETSASTLPPQTADQVILWSPPGSNPAIKADLESTLLSLLDAEELELISVENIAPGDLTTNVKAVLAIAPVEGLDTLASSNPSVQFLAVGMPGLTPSANLSVITPPENSLEQKAFMAGYLSVLVTDDYRAGVLVQSGSEIGNRLSGSFFVGARYLCGLCNARFAPVEYYPKVAEISDPQSQSEWQFAVDLLRNQGAQTIFVQPEIVTRPLLDYLVGAGANIILLDVNPNLISNTDNVAIIKNDYQSALTEIWPLLSNNEGGKYLEAGIALETESDWISEGRLRLFNTVFDDLEAGFIKPDPIN